MSCQVVDHRSKALDLQLLVEIYRVDLMQRPGGIFLRVEGLYPGGVFTLLLEPLDLPPRIFLLNMPGVGQHDLAQFGGGPGGINGPFVPGLHQQW